MHTIYLDNITVIDCAIANTGPTAKDIPAFGRSYAVRAEVSASTLNGVEAVVADFSSIKKGIKEFIDSDEGPDHKTIVPAGLLYASPLSKGNVALWSGDRLVMDVPANAVYTYDESSSPFLGGGFDDQSMRNQLACRLERDLGVRYPGLTFRITLTEDYSREGLRFHYTHGLAHSTSYGCQNILHGHSSVAYLTTVKEVRGADGVEAWASLHRKFSKLIERLTHTYFYHAAHETSTVAGPLLTYTTGRGTFNLPIPGRSQRLDFEPTIENLGQWMMEQLQAECTPEERSLLTGLYVSEGLWKGAFIEASRG